MPTRIVLKETSAPSRLTANQRAAQAVNSNHDDESSSHSRIGDEPHERPRSGRRAFRSSILKELNVWNAEEEEESDRPRLSSSDIRASPRLLGYLFALIASAVMLVSVVQFYRATPILPAGLQLDSDRYFISSSGALVYRWKLLGAVAVASGGCLLNLATLVAHYDVLCPRLWMAVFRDGSLAERNWIFCLIIYWLMGLHICTSSLSVGENQANVYFTTWIAFASTASNYAVWRDSAGLASLFANYHCRETTYNWLCTAVFSAIFAASSTDMYYNRSEINIRLRGEALNLTANDWTIILGVVWGEFVVCLLAIALNEWLIVSYRLPCRCHRPSGDYRCVLGWRQIEGLVILIAMGGKFYVILEYTGVDGVINGLSNAYFGVWGSFFNSVFALGSWLKENKSTAYLVKDGEEDDQA